MLQMSLIGSRHLSWYLDSGRSCHMIGERCMFQCLTPYHGGTISFRGNQKGKITEVRKLSIHPNLSIDNVLFVKGLKHNLLSISQFCIVSPSTKMSVSSYVKIGFLYPLLREKVTYTKSDWEISQIKRYLAYCLLKKITGCGIKNLVMRRNHSGSQIISNLIDHVQNR